MKTYSARPSEVEKKWVLIDAEGLVVGRAAAIIANRLRGKHRAIFTPHIDTGDNVVVINAEKVRVTGTKASKKMYYRHPHAGFPGALKSSNYETLQRRHPVAEVRAAAEEAARKRVLYGAGPHAIGTGVAYMGHAELYFDIDFKARSNTKSSFVMRISVGMTGMFNGQDHRGACGG